MFEVEYVSLNVWNVNKYNIDISFTTGEKTEVSAGGLVKTGVDKHSFNKVSKVITDNNDNIVKLLAWDDGPQ